MSLMTLASELNQSAQKYRKKLLTLPSIGIDEGIKYMTGFPGVTYQETIGELLSDAELRPYDGNTNSGENESMSERTLETFLGSCVELFDPNSVRQTIWAQLAAHGDAIKDPELRRAMLFAIMDSIMSKLNASLFTANRNASGSTTADLFNGFDTITDTEIAAGKIAAGKGNYKALSDEITSSNAYDTLKEVYRNMSDELKAKKSFMFVPFSVAEAYDDDYQATVGAIPYNNEFKKRFIEGSNGLCEIVPLVSKANSDYIHISTKKNMVYGYGAGVPGESIEVRRGDNPFKLQMILAMFFGTQFATLNKKTLHVAKLASASS